jgi:hypothetical protein
MVAQRQERSYAGLIAVPGTDQPETMVPQPRPAAVVAAPANS